MPFHVECGNNSFPDSEWTDFAFPIIYQWAEKLLENYRISSSSYTLYFMDGPYRLDVEQYNDKLKLAGVCFNKKRVDFEFVCSYLEFLSELLKASRFLTRMIRTQLSLDDCTETTSFCETARYYEKKIRPILKAQGAQGSTGDGGVC